jgi:hypothetical protein
VLTPTALDEEPGDQRTLNEHDRQDGKDAHESTGGSRVVADFSIARSRPVVGLFPR